MYGTSIGLGKRGMAASEPPPIESKAWIELMRASPLAQRFFALSPAAADAQQSLAECRQHLAANPGDARALFDAAWAWPRADVMTLIAMEFRAGVNPGYIEGPPWERCQHGG